MMHPLHHPTPCISPHVRNNFVEVILDLCWLWSEKHAPLRFERHCLQGICPSIATTIWNHTTGRRSVSAFSLNYRHNDAGQVLL
jgi:hypothetical protein